MWSVKKRQASSLFCKEGDVFLDVFGPSCRVFVYHGKKGAQAFTCVVKVGNGFLKAVHGQIGQHGLELAEGIAGTVKEAAVVYKVVGDRVWHVVASAVR